MSYWNQGYNRKKQEELDQEKTQRSPHHDIYLGSTSNWSKAREAQRKEAFAWKVGAGIITIMTGLFIWALIVL